MAGGRWPRVRRGGMGWLTNSDCDERGAHGPSLVALEGVGGRTRTEVETELEGSGVEGGLARAKITPEDGGSTWVVTTGEMRRELGREVSRLGTRGRGAVEELRE